jgi:uncharacterized repeat protein (TIGR01451 family)/gliding motility-associated-like protein
MRLILQANSILRLICFLCLVLIHSFCFSQVSPDINSGNPNFPFPQFLEYAGGKSLAHTNPVGVPHAELEQRTRDAYRILMNNVSMTGDVVAGVQYIKPSAPSTCDCAEGDGYYLLAMAYMGDKTNFDRLYMWVHDRSFNGTQRFIDGVVNTPGYLYAKGLSGAGGFGSGTATKGGATGTNSATDGDVDIALALLVANKQWGDLSGITVPVPYGGGQMSYKEEARKYIKALADTVRNNTISPAKFGSGDIGLDGYLKGGDTWAELTAWASPGYSGIVPEFSGPHTEYVDYNAPSYFNSFSKWLSSISDSPWCINQFKRASASGDWLMGQMNSKGYIPIAGNVVPLGPTSFDFTNFVQSEDMRAGWRTILNYVWNGNPKSTWDPVNHNVNPVINSYEKDLAINFAAFLKNPQSKGQTCFVPGSAPVTFKGSPTLTWGYSPSGAPGGGFRLNWLHGAGAPSAIAAQDFNLMAEMFRHCVIEWDGQGDGGIQKYLTSRPRYFHEWFRLLGMMILGGNYHDPINMNAAANMKVYMAVDKTYASTCDQLTYTISYRNYGKLDAAGVTITDVLPAGFTYVSSNKTPVVSGNTITWNLNTIPGFKTGGLAATMDSLTLVVKVNSAASGRLCNTVSIATTTPGGTGWTSNEYPNHITTVMERNCVDILNQAPMSIKKTVSKTLVNPSDTLSYTIVVKNNSVAFLNGGRQNIQIGFANDGTPAAAAELSLKYRFYHAADEAYINYNNYRVSYYMNKSGPPAWVLNTVTNSGFGGVTPTTTQQTLIPGASWNHRFITQFPSQIATITSFLFDYSGVGTNIHEGSMTPPLLVTKIHSAGYPVYDWSKDWSADAAALAADGTAYFPVSNNWTDPLNPNLPVTSLSRNVCETASHTVNNILVEEWDGYTWRRIYGNAPVAGRELQNVAVTDILPANVTFGGFISGYPVGTVAGKNISWPALPLLRISDSTVYKFWVTAGSSCPAYSLNTAIATATNECPVADTAGTGITCNKIISKPPPTSMYKTANALTYNVGDPITYSVKYKNTHGANVSPVLNNGTDWTAQSGPLMTVAGGKITSVSNSNSVMTYNYAHGKNGTISGSITPAPSATIGLAFRHSGGALANGLYVTFKPNPGAANVEIKFWNGAALLSTGTFPLPGGTFTFQLILTNATAQLWLNSTSGTPMVTQTGLPIKAGYAGFINGDASGADTWGTHSILSFNAHLDSGFNVQMTDPIPTDLTFTSASNAGTNTAGTVTWPVIAGPMLANDSITYTWSGVVATCSSGSIANTAYINMVGQPTNSIGAQSLVTCNGSTPPVTIPGIIAKNQNLCGSGVPAKFNSIKPASGGTPPYLYQWQSSPDSLVWNNIALATDTIYSPSTINKTTYFRRKVSAGGSPVYTAPVKVSVYPIVNAGSVGSSQTICYNQTPAGFTEVVPPSGGTGKYTFQWQSSMDSITFKNLVNDTLKNYAPGAILSTTYYRRQVFSGTCPVASSTNAITVTSVTPGTIGSNQSICYNTTPVALSNTALPSGGSPPYKYQWQASADSISYTDIPGETFTTYAPPALTATKWFRRNVTGTTCGTLSSLPAKITVYKVLNPGSVGYDQQICSGAAPDTLRSVSDASGGANSYSYQWQSSTNTISWTNINGAKSIFYKPPASSSLSYYRRQVVSGQCDTAVTVFIKINVIPNVTSSVNITDPGPICAGENVSLFANTSNGGTNPTYQWYLNGIAVPGETKITYSNSNLKDKDSLRVLMTSGLKCVNKPTVSSNKIIISVSTSVTPSVSINVSPGSTVCAGTPVQFNIGARSGQGNSPQYKWFLNNVNTGFTDTVYKPQSLLDGDSVQVEMTSSSGCAATKVVKSKAIPMKINPIVNPKVSIAVDKPVLCQGNRATFSIKTALNGGLNPQYQWQVNGISMPGKTDTIFSSTTLNNGDLVRVIMSSSQACTSKQKDTSSAIVITVNPNSTVNIVLSDPGAVCANTMLNFKASTSNAGTNPVFNWLVDGAAPTPNPAPGDSVLKIVLNNNQKVQVKVTSNKSCTAIPQVSSSTITVQITPGPKAATFTYSGSPYCKGTSNAIPALGNTGTTGIFSAGGGLSIKSTSGVVDLTLSQSGNYSITNQVSNSCGSDSTTAPLTITDQAIAGFTYAGNPYCQSAGTASPVFVPQGKAGTFASTSGLSLNTTTGDVNLLSSTPGSYSVSNSFPASGSCSAVSKSASIIITSGNPKASFSFAGSPYCLEVTNPNPAPVMASGASKGVFKSYPKGMIIDSLTGVISMQAGIPGNYTISNTVKSGCGSDSAKANVTLSHLPILNFSYNEFYCKSGPNPAPLFAGSATAGIFVSKNKNLVMDSTTGLINIAKTPAGTYFVSNTAPASKGCPATLQGGGLTILDIPTLNLTPDVHIGLGNSTTLTASGASNYSWTPAIGLSCTTCSSTIAAPDKTTLYTVVADNKGCKAVGKVQVIVDPCADVFVPNAFDPGGSGQNSMLCVYGNCIQSLHFMIFDRWGEKVFESNEIALCWDGRFNGTLMNSGEFVYVLTAILTGGTPISKKGNISLIR